jgi:limonene-1,2-epoxide hydrolase
VWRIFTGLTEFRYRGPVGASADEDLVDILSFDFSIIRETEINFLVERVDDEIKELVLVDFTVCLP